LLHGGVSQGVAEGVEVLVAALDRGTGCVAKLVVSDHGCGWTVRVAFDVNLETRVSPTRRLGDGHMKTSKAHPGTLSWCWGPILIKGSLGEKLPSYGELKDAKKSVK